MSIQYDQYLENHNANVKKAFEWFRKNLPEILVGDYDYEHQIVYGHDASKVTPDEYEAYDAYFYGGNRSFSVVRNFKTAFLNHIHRNPHHWQHWILIQDDPNQDEIVMEMPHNYMIEMICDWWSFSWSKGKLNEIFTWYDEHKEHIKLGTVTRYNLEVILCQMKEKLNQ